MPVPKRQHSRSRSRKRAAGKNKIPLVSGVCSNCSSVKIQHSVCSECGFYKGEKVLRTKSERAEERSLARSAKRSTKAKDEKPKTLDVEGKDKKSGS